MYIRTRHLCSALLVLLTLVCSAAALDVGRVVGVIRDKASGLPVAGAEVLLIYLNQNTEQRKITSDRGEFQFDQVYPPGRYKIVVLCKGFRTTEFNGLNVAINTTSRPDPPIVLESDVFSSSPLTIEGRTAVVDSADAAPKVAFEPEQIQNLPLAGMRSFDQLGLLAPGVTDVPASGGSGPGVGPGVGTAGQFSVNGQRGRNNSFLVDLSDNNDQDVGVRRQGYISLVPQSVESIQNYQLIAGSYKAEFGRNSGSIVNAISRSGGNDVHGTAYGYFSDRHLAARDFFDQIDGPVPGRSPFQRSQWGAVAGGPIVRNKAFWFTSFEHQHRMARPEKHFAVPLLAQRAFFGHSPLLYGAANETDSQGQRLDDLTQYFFKQNVALFGLAGRGVWNLVPMPNNPSGPYGTNTYTEQLNADGTGNVVSFKVDHQMPRAGTLTARYNATRDDSTIPVTGEAIHSSIHPDIHTQNLTVFLNGAIAGGASNQVRFSYGRTLLNFLEVPGSPLLFGSADQSALAQWKVVDPGSIRDQILKTPIRTDFGSGTYGPFGTTGALGQLRIRPFSPVGVDVFNFPQKRANNTFQYADTLVYQRRTHTARISADIRRVQQNSRLDHLLRPLADFSGALGTRINLMNGVVRGTDLASIGYATGFFQVLVPDFNDDGKADFDTNVGLRFTEFSFSFEDDWKLGENLNLSMGLRYEWSTAPREVNRKIETTFADVLGGVPSGSAPAPLASYETTFDKITSGVASILDGRNSIYEPDRNSFAPRLGFAWDPTGTGKTAVRGAYGLFHDQIITSVTSQSRNVFPHLIPLNSGGFGVKLQGVFLTNPQHLILNDLAREIPVILPGSLNTVGTPGGYFKSLVGLLKDRYGQGVAFTLPTRKLQAPYAQHYHLTIEREILPETLLSIAYFGSRGVHLTRSRFPNGGLSGSPSFACLASNLVPGFCDLIGQTAPPPRQDPRLGSFTIIENSASSNFHSLQLWARGRLGQRFSFTTSYAWSHALDDVSDVFDGLGFFVQPQSENDLRAERASANFDARHRATASFVWELPWKNHGKALGGWMISGIFMARTGQPFTVNSAFDVNNDGSLSDRLDTVEGIRHVKGGPAVYSLPPGTAQGGVALQFLAKPGNSGRVGRNTFRAQGMATLDLSVFKAIQLSPRQKLELRCEIFNVLNKTQFGVPVRILEAPGFGNSVDTAAGPRLLQLAVKLHF